MALSNRHDDPAHPTYAEGVLAYPGLSVREWFAGQALVGILANASMTPQDAASEAVRHADALIARLQQPRL